MIQRISTLVRRLRKSRSLGVRFSGTRSFQMPTGFSRFGSNHPIHCPSDPALALDFINLLLDDEYGIEHLTPAPRTILDIGANIGLFSLHASSLYPRTVVHAYEPNPSIFPFLEKNLSPLAGKAFHEAVGSTAGTVSCVESASSRTGTVTDGGTIPRCSLADAIKRLGGWVDLLKLDCEGAEWDILQDRQSLRQVRFIRMEYHLSDGRTLEDFLQLVNQAGLSLDFLDQNSNFGLAYLSNPLVS